MNSSIRICVKGNMAQTADAIHSHIPRADAEFIHHAPATFDCVWAIHPNHRAEVVAWFTEPPHSIPYPIGTLLFYSEVEP